MKRKLIFLWGPILTLVMFAVSLGILRLYLAEAAEILVADLTGAGAEIERVDMVWFPPAITIHDLKLDTGSERIDAPRIDLYPNFSGILDGEISLDRAMFDQPLVRTSITSKSGSGFDLALLPKSISIRGASFIIDENGIPSSPVSFSADIEKEESGFFFTVKNVRIPEFGLTFSGLVDVSSISPLKLDIDAEKGAFNPSALLDFLRRFKYLDDTALTMFSQAKAISAEKFSLNFDAGTRFMSFAARSFVVDGSRLADFVTHVDSKGGWAIACTEGNLDAAQLLTLAKAHPDSGKSLADGLSAMGFKNLTAEGVISLKELRVQSSGHARPSGTLSLSTPSLQVHLVSERGESQDMTLKDFDGVVTIRNGKSMVSIKSLDMASSAGGEAVITGELPLPFALAGTRFQAEARQLEWFGTKLDGTAVKKSARQIDFDLNMQLDKTMISAKGLARNEYRGANRWAAIVDDLVIKTATDNGKSEDKTATPFDFGFVRDGTLSGKIVVRRLQYNDLPVIRDLSAKVSSIKGRTTIKGRGRLCLMKIGMKAVLTPDSVVSTLTVKGTGVQLPGVLGCFVDELPVYIRGQIALQVNLFMQGNSVQEWKNSVRGDAVVRLKDLTVLKLANLDKRLGFFLEIINAVGFEPGKGDTLTFRDGIIAVSVKGADILLKSVRLGGGQVSVSGKGRFNIDGKRLHLDVQVTTPLGARKNISIDRVLSGEKV